MAAAAGSRRTQGLALIGALGRTWGYRCSTAAAAGHKTAT